MSDTDAGRLRGDLVSKAWRHLASERRSLLGLAALAVAAAQAESVGLVMVALLADAVAAGGSTLQFSFGPIDVTMSTAEAGLTTLGAFVLAAAATFGNLRISATKAARLERISRDDLVEAFASATWEYQAAQSSSRLQGSLLRLMDSKAGAFSGLVAWMRSSTTIIIFIVVAALMSPFAAILILASGAALSLAIFPLRRKVARLSGHLAGEETILATDVAEAASHGADVHVFGAWPAFVHRFSSKSNAVEELMDRLGATKSLMPVIYQYGGLTLILLVLVFATTAPALGGFGRFAASALLLLRSLQYGQQLQTALQRLAHYVPRIVIMARRTKAPPRLVDRGTDRLTEIKTLQLQEVDYRYPGASENAVVGVSITLGTGRIVGIAGPSGSGKSTLAQIMLRLREPSTGSYLVNGVPASSFTFASWHRLVSHVPQQPLLLQGTIYENVAFLDPSVSLGRAEEAMRAVGLGELIEALPFGLETPIGPTQRDLSVGQVQRMGIARALARDPQLVVLDEPTSALDIDAERIVGDALSALRQNSDGLVVVIAHRPSTLALCDEIIVLKEGAIESFGRIDEVAAINRFLERTWGTDSSQP